MDTRFWKEGGGMTVKYYNRAHLHIQERGGTASEEIY